jgi:hypothetical protein
MEETGVLWLGNDLRLFAGRTMNILILTGVKSNTSNPRPIPGHRLSKVDYAAFE